MRPRGVRRGRRCPRHGQFDRAARGTCWVGKRSDSSQKELYQILHAVQQSHLVLLGGPRPGSKTGGIIHGVAQVQACSREEGRRAAGLCTHKHRAGCRWHPRTRARAGPPARGAQSATSFVLPCVLNLSGDQEPPFEPGATPRTEAREAAPRSRTPGTPGSNPSRLHPRGRERGRECVAGELGTKYPAAVRVVLTVGNEYEVVDPFAHPDRPSACALSSGGVLALAGCGSTRRVFPATSLESSR